MLDVAKCNIGKVKIEPMLVGLCLLGSEDNPQSARDTMEGGRKGLASALRWRGILLVCLRIVAFS